MHCKSLWIKASAKCINVNVQGKLEWGRSNRHRGIHRSLDSVWGLQVQKWKRCQFMGCRHRSGKHLQGTCKSYLWVMWISSQMTSCTAHTNASVSHLHELKTTTRCSLMWFSIWQCQCFCFSVTMVRFVVPWYCLFDSVSVQDIYNWNITVLVCCSMKCYNVKT